MSLCTHSVEFESSPSCRRRHSDPHGRVSANTFDVKNINKMQKNQVFSGLDWFFSGFGPVFLKTGWNHFGLVFKWSMNHSQASQSSPVQSSSKKGKKTGLDWTFKL